ncbi:2,3-bisphosphoglycerate-independent phosphoglycerate mutase [bacterium]|nr:2,3-bisphosphoglycerate-independent phosphoglycerate mutase [bacterium]
MAHPEHKPVLLLILDGWGLGPDPDNSAIELARTPTWDKLWAEYPRTRLVPHGTAVGLMQGQMGNSEVGHLNLGAGRVVYQDLLKINRMIERGELASHAKLNSFLREVAGGSSVLHFIGLFSDGGVHSHLNHLQALTALAQQRGVGRIWIHALLDGRDTRPRIAEGYFERFSEGMPPAARFATLGGRYFGMDRDRRWERTQKAWDAIVHADARRTTGWEAAMHTAREQDEGDEFVVPAVLGDYPGMEEGDGVLFFNFRADRMRQLAAALLLGDFNDFDRGSVPRVTVFSTRRYRDDFANDVLLENATVPQTINEVLSGRGLAVYKGAETEKYAHVTYFFNGGREAPWPGEDSVLISSPRVATYDLKPEMSVHELTERLATELARPRHEFYVVNFANGDMVGHTGVRQACIEACEAVDQCLKQVMDAAGWGSGVDVIVTADHGNCDVLTWPDGTPHTQHSMSEVPLVLAAEPRRQLKQPEEAAAQGREAWSLRDVAPTIMELLGLAPPPDWTGVSLLA